MKKITESDSLYTDLEKMDALSLLSNINKEDKKVAIAVEHAIPEISKLVDILSEKMSDGGRLFYIGAGTSGRLGILDASECPPTYGVPRGMVIGLIAGGDAAIRNSVEHAEDDTEQAMLDLQAYDISDMDVVVGIAASGTTPYVVGGLRDCKKQGIITGAITCNPGTPVLEFADHPMVAEVGPEFVTGSTRMKSGTAQKMILNMITTATMIKLGKVKGNKMVDMQLSNDKLVDRGTRMIMKETGVDYELAKTHLLDAGSVRNAIEKIDVSLKEN